MRERCPFASLRPPPIGLRNFDWFGQPGCIWFPLFSLPLSCLERFIVWALSACRLRNWLSCIKGREEGPEKSVNWIKNVRKKHEKSGWPKMRHTPHSCSIPRFPPRPLGDIFLWVMFSVDFIEREREKSSSVFECTTTTSSAPWATPSPSPPLFSHFHVSLSLPPRFQHRGNFLQESSTSGRGIVVAWYGLIRDICEHEEYSPTGTWSSKAEKKQTDFEWLWRAELMRNPRSYFSMYFFLLLSCVRVTQ